MLQPDSMLGPYRLIARIGAGGMGEVWKAEDTRLGRTVAIKVLPARVAADAEATARLKREARTAAQLYHSNIATIHSIEQDGERLFIVMELVEGEPLTQLIRRGPMPEADVCRIGRSVADALAEAHAKGIVHRDIKPDNIMVRGARVKVLDFGIAKQVGAVPASPDAPTAFETQQGIVLGTIHYMSPEQALGKPVDGRTDIFSLGVVLYEAATGRLPFRGETVTETMTQIIRDEPADAATVNPRVSPALNEIIRRCLRKNRDERFTAEELRDALDRQVTRATTEIMPLAPPTVVTAPQRTTSRLPLLVILGLPVLLLGVATVAYLLRPPPAANPSVGAPASGAPARPRVAAPTQTAITVTAPPPAPQPKPDTSHPHYARGMFALMNRNFPVAREHLGAALDSGRLDEREQALARLGLAIASFNRPEAAAIARQIRERWPGDPDLMRIERMIRPRRRPF
jgi:serine/threonine protein kinase